MSVIEDFFADIDRPWSGDNAKLSIIGCGALMLQVDYERGTKDGDVFETIDLSSETKSQLLTNLHRVERDMLGVDETEIELPSWI
jgi:hypothetical protein